jgi:hypothetical protein
LGEPHASRLGALAPLAGAGADQRTLEFGETAEDGERGLAEWRR